MKLSARLLKVECPLLATAVTGPQLTNDRDQPEADEAAVRRGPTRPRRPQPLPFPLSGNGLLGELAGPDRLRCALFLPDRHPRGAAKPEAGPALK